VGGRRAGCRLLQPTALGAAQAAGWAGGGYGKGYDSNRGLHARRVFHRSHQTQKGPPAARMVGAVRGRAERDEAARAEGWAHRRQSSQHVRCRPSPHSVLCGGADTPCRRRFAPLRAATHTDCVRAPQDPSEDYVFTGGSHGEVRAWNYKTGADIWQNTRLAPDPNDRRRQIVPGKDPKCTLLVYGIGDFNEEQLGDVLVGRQLTDTKPLWASVCPPTAGGSEDITRWALVGVATAEDADKCVARCAEWTPEWRTGQVDGDIDDGRVLKIFRFDPARADERDLVGFGAMRMMRQDRGKPVTALALHETNAAQVWHSLHAPSPGRHKLASCVLCPTLAGSMANPAAHVHTAVDFCWLRGHERARYGWRDRATSLDVLWILGSRACSFCVVDGYPLQCGRALSAVPR
jgi:hypothetical protein